MTHTHSVGLSRRRDLYLTTHNNHKRKISMPTAGFEPAIPSSKRRKTHASDLVASRTGIYVNVNYKEKNPLPITYFRPRDIIPQYSYQQKASKYQNCSTSNVRDNQSVVLKMLHFFWHEKGQK